MLRKYATPCLVLLLWFGMAQWGYSQTAFNKGMSALSAGNYAEAYCYWKPLALRGDMESQYNIAWLYANGNGMNVDAKTALHWWKQAASRGHQDARFAVGMAYITGEGIKADADEALKWFLLAANGGMLDAQEIINRLSVDSRYTILQNHPEVLQYDWFGRPARVSADKLNVRKKPGTKSSIVAKLSRGDLVRVVAEKDNWLKIVMGKNTNNGWVYKPLVTYEK